jgi:hypothetical protein
MLLTHDPAFKREALSERSAPLERGHLVVRIALSWSTQEMARVS